MFRAIFVDDTGYPTCSLCYFTEKQALDDIMRRRPDRDMVEECRYKAFRDDLDIIILREIFDDVSVGGECR